MCITDKEMAAIHVEGCQWLV